MLSYSFGKEIESSGCHCLSKHSCKKSKNSKRKNLLPHFFYTQQGEKKASVMIFLSGLTYLRYIILDLQMKIVLTKVGNTINKMLQAVIYVTGFLN